MMSPLKILVFCMTWKKEFTSSYESTQTECFVRKHVLETYRKDLLKVCRV